MKTLLEMKQAGKLLNADGTSGVKLIYIDPPFATKREFRGSQEQKAYQDKIAGAEFIEFLRRRIVLLRELLTPNGALYIHLDTKKSHYIKIILDELFGEANFRNEIIWSDECPTMTLCGSIHDTLLFYTRSQEWTWNRVPRAEFKIMSICFLTKLNQEPIGGMPEVIYLLVVFPVVGMSTNFAGVKRVWRAPKSTLERYEAEGKLHWPKTGVPRLKRYLDEFEGVPLQDIWADLRVIYNQSSERIDYPTQKPESLAERIILSSSNPGDIVLTYLPARARPALWRRSWADAGLPSTAASWRSTPSKSVCCRSIRRSGRRASR